MEIKDYVKQYRDLQNNDFQEETEAKYKKQMEDMAAEYEAKIAEIQNQKKTGI